MGYNSIDLVDKAIDTSNKILNFYENIKNNNNISSFNVFVNILKKHEKEKINYYKGLKESMDYESTKEINFFLYDKISSLITQFNNKISSHSCGINTKELIECAIEINKDVRALFIDVRGRITKDEDDWETSEYKVLSIIINIQEEYIKKLEQLYNKSYIGKQAPI
ncbi:hypothetical protein [Clostridium senegalense]|uniref:DUF2383 domain-containing protein n=1 Tax=Clostridium senegalense TaxID=1465809 RepID=A0A6M0GZ19_9CLOT|nr:hypothetical protein [Clostridium senegalense]NEU03437.1 hypothetical protein [Clostridium senegalense]